MLKSVKPDFDLEGSRNMVPKERNTFKETPVFKPRIGKFYSPAASCKGMSLGKEAFHSRDILRMKEKAYEMQCHLLRDSEWEDLTDK